MRIVFVARQCVPFHAESLIQRPLGGTETAVIRVARALHDMGHDVTVMSPVLDPPPGRPAYVTCTDAALAQLGPVDVLVAVRDWTILLSDIEARVRLFWTPDSFDVPQTFGIGDKRVSARIDALLVGSRWHATSLCGRSGFPLDKAWVLGCGIHAPDFAGTEQRRRKRLIYSSTPFRGLSLLPSIYRRIKVLHPDAELHVFSGYATYKNGPGGNEMPWQKEWERLAGELRTLPDCIVHDNIRQCELAREYMKSSVLAYPNAINETCCITAIEAQAAGCAIVSSHRAALPETVAGAGLLIAGLPGTQQYEDQFVDAVDRLLRDDELFSNCSAAGRRRALEQLNWTAVAARFAGFAANALTAQAETRLPQA
jgi:glycosyltransferase involved in cell wall biosynthesis